jgi:bifunctional DNase/RNase
MKDVIFPAVFEKIIQANQYTAFILSANEKQFAIYTTPSTGEYVQRVFTDKPFIRPQTIDLIGSILSGLNVIPLQLIIHDVIDAIYHCKLFLAEPGADHQKILEIDTRPSDGLALALIYNLPIYCTPQLLEKSDSYEE